MSEMSVPGGVQGGAAGPDPRRWLILAVIGTAQLMIILDITVMNIALPSAQHAAFWTSAAIFGAGALICGALLRPGPLFPRGAPSDAGSDRNATVRSEQIYFLTERSMARARPSR